MIYPMGEVEERTDERNAEEQVTRKGSSFRGNDQLHLSNGPMEKKPSYRQAPLHRTTHQGKPLKEKRIAAEKPSAQPLGGGERGGVTYRV